MHVKSTSINGSVRGSPSECGRSRERLIYVFHWLSVRSTPTEVWLIANKRRPLIRMLPPQEVSKKENSRETDVNTYRRPSNRFFKVIITLTPPKPPLIASSLSQRTSRATIKSYVTKCSLQETHLAYRIRPHNRDLAFNLSSRYQCPSACKPMQLRP